MKKQTVFLLHPKGLVYYQRGRGWKLRLHWRETLAEKRQAIIGKLLQEISLHD